MTGLQLHYFFHVKLLACNSWSSEEVVMICLSEPPKFLSLTGIENSDC